MYHRFKITFLLLGISYDEHSKLPHKKVFTLLKYHSKFLDKQVSLRIFLWKSSSHTFLKSYF